ncbi:MAG TPA: glycosyltransferase family 4 protein [bacterium]
MIKILYFNPSSKIGGAEKSLLDLAENIDSRRYSPVVCLPEDGPLSDYLKAKNIEVRLIKIPRPVFISARRMNLVNILNMVLFPALIPLVVYRIGTIIGQEKPYIVHTNGIKFHFLCSLLKPFISFKLLWHFRDIPAENMWRWLISVFAYIFPDKIIVNSDVVKEIFSKNQQTDKKTFRVYNGINIKKFTPTLPPEVIRKNLGYDREFIIGIFSMFTEWKGHRVLIKAVKILSKTISDIRVLIVGDELYDTVRDRGYKEFLRSIVRTDSIENFIKFLGYREDIPDIMNAVNVVVNPTIRPEPFGRVILEAISLGKPVVVTENGGLTQIIREKKLGLVIPPNDEYGLARALEYLYNDFSIQNEVNLKGRQFVKEMFSVEKYVAEVQKIYDSMHIQ